MPTGSVTPAGGGGPAAGSYLPTGDAAGVTVDSTTYDDPIKGGGAKLTALIFPRLQGALAIAETGDNFPRWLMSSRAGDGLYMGGGNTQPYTGGLNIYQTGGASGSGLVIDASKNATGSLNFTCGSSGSIGIGSNANASVFTDGLPSVPGVATVAITSGALPTKSFSSGTADQVATTRDVSLTVPFTGDATNNAATLKIELSPDNLTFSTLDTLSIAAALNLTGALNTPVSFTVPAAWYVTLTATHGTIGTATYY